MVHLHQNQGEFAQRFTRPTIVVIRLIHPGKGAWLISVSCPSLMTVDFVCVLRAARWRICFVHNYSCHSRPCIDFAWNLLGRMGRFWCEQTINMSICRSLRRYLHSSLSTAA